MRDDEYSFDDGPASIEGVLGAYRQVVELWLLRLLIRAGLHTRFLGENLFLDDGILSCLAIEAPGRGKKYDRGKVYDSLKSRLGVLESAPPELPTHTTLARQLAWFAARAGIDGPSLAVLHFAVLATQIRPLGTALDALGGLQENDVVHVFATTPGLPRTSVADALADNAALVRSGILWIDPDGALVFSRKVVVPRDAAGRLGVDYEDPMEVFRGIVAPGKTSTLSLQDYPHLAEELTALRAYLVEALRTRQSGVNVLVYGPPGTGKTELVRALAQDIRAELHEVPTCRPSGAALTGGERLRLCRLGQTLLGGQGDAILLLDEAEDVFNPESVEQRRTRHYTKSWFNQFLEANTLPTLWLSNSLYVSDMGFVRSLDPAYLRRFDFVLKVDIPPRSVRRRILENHLAEVPVESGWVSRMAEHDQLPPAVVQRAARVLGRIHGALPAGALEKTMEQLLGNTLEVMGHDRKPRHYAESNTGYRLDCVNVESDLEQVCQCLKRSRSGRLCLYGPPGTGKTALGRHVAEYIDAPLLIRRASDILSPWIGETEKNLARMFTEADREGAVLLLDEADTFLQSRHAASRSWEISQVNEMLTQMEAFQGVFIASTNLMDTLDPAAMRRFDLKLRFDYLRREQVFALFADGLERLGLAASWDDATTALLNRLHELTPGDFSVVLRRSRLTPITSAWALAEALQGECAVKPGGGRPSVGFVH